MAICANLHGVSFAQTVDSPRIMAGGYYFREPTDRAWTLKFVGEVSSYPGAYLLLHDAQGRLLHSGALPKGSYTQEAPFVVSFPVDGVTGDYRLVLLGGQEISMGLQLPLSDLPYEVYGDISSLGQPPVPAFFKAPAGVTQMALGAHRGNLRVLNANGKVLADTRTSGKTLEQMDKEQRDRNAKAFNQYANIIEFPVGPEQTYILDANGTMYLGAREQLYVAFEAARWFQPNSQLVEVKWWELVKL